MNQVRPVLLLVLLFITPLFPKDPPWRLATPGYRYEFPRDHFDHPDFRTEWWYYTGTVRTTTGRRYGFELVFFRQGQRRGPASNRSVWRIEDLYLAHLALTDVGERSFRSYRRLNRSGPGIAGISRQEGRIWNGNWEAKWNAAGPQTLTATAEGVRFRLELRALKPAIIHGENGISRKAEGEGAASHYVSFPRLAVEGTINGQSVTGTAWMDHEWFTNQLSPEQAGWDWFSIQLDNSTEVMLFQLRRKDGSIDPWSAGTYIDARGRAQHLGAQAFRLEPLEFWKSPKTGARYPIGWRIVIPSIGVTLECTAVLPNQELTSEDGPSYWEGAVNYTGSVNGVGYLEMTGYDKPIRLD
jgi:predicted secreted hydrolase